MANVTLFNWGPIQFEVYPFNINELDHQTGTEWAKKEIAGAAIHREWVGENDEQIILRGKVFPIWMAQKINQRAVAQFPDGDNKPKMDQRSTGGLSHLDIMDNMRRLGQAHVLQRGDGWHLGWYVIDTLTRGHAFLAQDGIGQQISFQATFQRVPVPVDPMAYFHEFYGHIG